MGLTDKITGRAKKAAGDISGDSKLKRDGGKEEKKAEAKEQLDRSQQQTADKAAEVSDLERKT